MVLPQRVRGIRSIGSISIIGVFEVLGVLRSECTMNDIVLRVFGVILLEYYSLLNTPNTTRILLTP